MKNRKQYFVAMQNNFIAHRQIIQAAVNITWYHGYTYSVQTSANLIKF